ncbi:MAG: hypothetical protein ACE5SW_08095 [Nitrososphaeraceae archaeon]
MNNPINLTDNLITKEIKNYIDYELKIFETLTNRKFFFTVLESGKLELHGYEEANDNERKITYPIIFRANNLYQFIAKLMMIREFLQTKFNGIN